MSFIRKDRNGLRNPADMDVSFQLFRDGMVLDGDVTSKSSRDHFVDSGYAVRVAGYQSLTWRGSLAYLSSPCVWWYLARRWYELGRNPFRRDLPPKGRLGASDRHWVD